MSVEDEARARAEHTLADGKPIMERALLLRCAGEIARLKSALREIAKSGPTRGGIWARQQAENALAQEP